MHNPESVQEKVTHKILWDFEIQADHLISTKRPDLVKKGCVCVGGEIVDFALPADYKVKLKESVKKNEYLDLAKKLKNTMEYEGDADTNCNLRARYSHDRFGTETRGFGNKRMSGDKPIYSIIEISQNTKSLGDLRRLVVT